MIKNKKQLLRQFKTSKILLDLAEDVLEFLQPDNLIKNQVKFKNNKLSIQDKVFDLEKYRNIFIIGAGKATYEMAKSINKLLKNKITAGYINVPEAKTKKIGKIIVNQASHPFPNQAGVNGAKKILQIAERATKNDLIICLMSGGGSALMPLPADGMNLKQKIDLTNKLLKCSADIKEINTIRKHISKIKGGRLASVAMPADIISLYISDVVGDDLQAIASGPTVIDKTTCNKAIKILEKYNIKNKTIFSIIKKNESAKKLNNKKVFNFIIGNNKQALEHLIIKAKQKKYKTVFLSSELEGEAKQVAKFLVTLGKDIKNSNTIIFAGGETTVKIIGNGYGGRNQELVLSALNYLSQNMTILSLATDGADGITPQPIGGALVSGDTLEKYNRKIKINKYIANNDSYTCLSKLRCVLKTGLTGTNVGDIIMLLIKK